MWCAVLLLVTITILRRFILCLHRSYPLPLQLLQSVVLLFHQSYQLCLNGLIRFFGLHDLLPGEVNDCFFGSSEEHSHLGRFNTSLPLQLACHARDSNGWKAFTQLLYRICLDFDSALEVFSFVILVFALLRLGFYVKQSALSNNVVWASVRKSVEWNPYPLQCSWASSPTSSPFVVSSLLGACLILP